MDGQRREDGQADGEPRGPAAVGDNRTPQSDAGDPASDVHAETGVDDGAFSETLASEPDGQQTRRDPVSPVSVTVRAPMPAAPRTIGPFTLQDRLGAGGMGEVYRAVDTRLGRAVALKLLPEEVCAHPKRRARFLREARAAAATTHRSIATIYEVGESGTQLYLAMELVEGQTLRPLVREGGLSVEEVLGIVRDIAAGLAAAHAAGVVHRDLKPDNIMRTPRGEVRILDFGLARSSAALPEDAASGEDGAALTQEGQLLGTPGYMSPEQALGEPVDARADVYALGVVAWELLAGRILWRGPTPMARVVAPVREAPPSLAEIRADVPPDVLAFLDRCLAREAEDRYADGAEALAALEAMAALAPTPPPASAVAVGQTAPLLDPAASTVSGVNAAFAPKPAGRRAGVWIGAALALAVAALATWWWSRPKVPPSLRNLPQVSESAEGQAAFAEVVQAHYDRDAKRVLQKVQLARSRGASGPLLDVLEALAEGSSSSRTDALKRMEEARREVEGRSDPTAATLRTLVRWSTDYATSEAKVAAELATLLPSLGDHYLLRVLILQFMPYEAPNEARRLAEALIAEDPAPLAVHLMRIDYLVGKDAWSEVLTSVEALEAQGRHTQELSNTRGMALVGLRRWDEARRAFEAGLAQDPGNWTARAGLMELATETEDAKTLQRHVDAFLSDTAPRMVAAHALYFQSLRLCARGRALEAEALVRQFAAPGRPRDAATLTMATYSVSALNTLSWSPPVRRLRPVIVGVCDIPGVGETLPKLCQDVLLSIDTIVAWRENPPGAQALFRKVAEIARTDRWRPSDRLTNLVRMAILLGDREAAKGHLAKVSLPPGDDWQALIARYVYALQLYDVGEYEQARAQWEMVTATASKCRERLENTQQLCRVPVARAIGDLHRDALRRGALDEARTHEAALRKWWPRADPELMAWLLRGDEPVAAPGAVTPTRP